MKYFFDPVLEYRRFTQVYRSEEEKAMKLNALAGTTRMHRELLIGKLPKEKIIAAILDGYRRGEDILDPNFFDRQDIVDFATENGLLNDPQVLAAITAAKPRETA